MIQGFSNQDIEDLVQAFIWHSRGYDLEYYSNRYWQHNGLQRGGGGVVDGHCALIVGLCRVFSSGLQNNDPARGQLDKRKILSSGPGVFGPV